MTRLPESHMDLIEQMQQVAMLSQSYIEGLSESDFMADKKTQYAVSMALLLIGELATTLVSNHVEFVSQHPEIPWHKIKGMRNRLAHNYFEMELALVWDTVQKYVPELAKDLQAIRPFPWNIP